MSNKKFLEIPSDEGLNLYIEIDSNTNEEALKALGATATSRKENDSDDFMDRYSLEDKGNSVIEGSAHLFEKVGQSITHIGKEIYSSIEELQPDVATVKFGVKINSEVGGILLVKAGIDAEFSVSLTWKKVEKGD